MAEVRAVLEVRQVAIYFVAITSGAFAGLTVSKAGALEVVINPALAVMLFVTFLQVPLAELYAVLAPVTGWLTARSLRLEPAAARAVSFSAATRNSLVVPPLAFAVPGGVPLIPAVIVTQTIIELVSELLYVRWIPRLSGRPAI